MPKIIQNVKVDVKKNILTLTVDLSKDLGESSSGRTRIIATSGGNQPVEGFENTLFGLNVFKYPPRETTKK